MSDAQEVGVRQALAAAADEIAELTSTLVQTPSVSGQEGAVGLVMLEQLRAAGLEASLRSVPEHLYAGGAGEFSAETNVEARPNVVAWLRSSSAEPRPPVVLNGHLDVVPPGDEAAWSVGAWSGERRDGCVWGRGAADMKGPLAAAVIALRTLAREHVELPFDVQLQCVIAEESSSLGTVAALETEQWPSGVIVLEPSAGVVVPAGGGSLQFTVHTSGQAAHAAVPWTGRSALDPLVDLYVQVREFAERRNEQVRHPLFDALPQPVPFGVGAFVSGEWRAMLPESGEFSGRIGLLPGESIDALRAALQRVIDEAAAARPGVAAADPRISWPNAGFLPWETPIGSPLVQALAEASKAVRGSDATIQAVTFGADAGRFAAAGIPVAIFGPGHIEHAHMTDERISEAELLEAAQVIATALMRLAELA